jgi:hypothetical protein
MKKFSKLLLKLTVFILFPQLIFSIPVSYNTDAKQVYQNINTGSFSQKKLWYNLDSNIDFISNSVQTYTNESSETVLELETTYMTEFDYEPDTKTVLLEYEQKDKILIKSEGNVSLQTKYIDAYDNEISAGYPKIYYKKENSQSPFTEQQLTSKGNNIFYIDLNLDYGVYDYYFNAKNEHYPDEFVSEQQKLIITERPKNFNLVSPKNVEIDDEKQAILDTNVIFKWDVLPGVEGDTLTNTLYYGTNKTDMQKIDLNEATEYEIPKLNPRTRYYWKVSIQNQYGAQLADEQIYTFITGGNIKKAYNAPNPFNPQKGENTDILFYMSDSGRAEIHIYSEYGDKIKSFSVNNLASGNNYVTYNGTDDKGNILYNGTYLCIIKKKYTGRTETEKCRLLIIK